MIHWEPVENKELPIGNVPNLTQCCLFLYLLVVLPPMLTKAVPRAIACSARLFHSSASVSRVVAANPPKAEEVKVLVISCSLSIKDLTFYFFSRGLPENIPSLSMNSMLSSCKHCFHLNDRQVSSSPLKRCWWCWSPCCLRSCRGRIQDRLYN